VADRRGFLKELLGAGAELVQDVGEALRTALEPELPPEPAERIVPAGPVLRTASPADLEELLEASGLAPAHADAARQLARVGLRLVPGEGRSRLGGLPELPEGVDWPSRDGRPLAFLAQIELPEAAGLGLPESGSLAFFYDLELQPEGLAPADEDSCRVLRVGGGGPRQGHAAFAERRLELSRELMLPTAYSSRLDPFELDVEAYPPWSELRIRLAGLQGVPLDDETVDVVATQRLLGYAEPVWGREMELDCALVAGGLDLSEGHGYYDPRRDALEARAPEWRLLLQLSTDPELGFALREPFRRLYLWIHERDLAAGDFRHVRPILQ
jgi:hypothetical protein